MGGCESGHEWRPEREHTSYVLYRCEGCDSICVAPTPVEELPLDVRSTPSPRPTADAEARRAMEAPFWASAWSWTSSPAAG
jgi:hypothetical protein